MKPSLPAPLLSIIVRPREEEMVPVASKTNYFVARSPRSGYIGCYNLAQIKELVTAGELALSAWAVESDGRSFSQFVREDDGVRWRMVEQVLSEALGSVACQPILNASRQNAGAGRRRAWGFEVLCFGGLVSLVGAGLYIGNKSGIMPTIPLAGFVVMGIGGVISSIGMAMSARGGSGGKPP